MEPPSGFEPRPLNGGIQHPNHYTIAPNLSSISILKAIKKHTYINISLDIPKAKIKSRDYTLLIKPCDKKFYFLLAGGMIFVNFV